MAIFLREPDPLKAIKDIKLAVFLKYKSLTASADTWKMLDNVMFEISGGMHAYMYFSALIDIIATCDQTIGNDVTSITVFNTILADIPSDVAIELYSQQAKISSSTQQVNPEHRSIVLIGSDRFRPPVVLEMRIKFLCARA